MTLKEILNTLVEIEGQLDDAYYSLPEYNANTDSQGSIDGARSDLYGLKDDIERAILDSKDVPGFEGTLEELDEVMNTSPTLAKLL